MEENDVKCTHGGTRLEFKMGNYENFYIENLTRCYIFYWKSERTKKVCFKIWPVVLFSSQNLTRCIFFESKSDALCFFWSQNLTRCFFFDSKSDALYFFRVKIWRAVAFPFQNLTRDEIFEYKIMLLKKARKFKISRFHRVKWTKTWFFECEKFFKIWHVEKFLIQNLTRCIFFNPESNAL